MTKFTKALFVASLLLLSNAALYAQRPEALYVQKAIKGQPLPKANRQRVTATGAKAAATGVRSNAVALAAASCPECYTLSLTNYTPDNVYVSFYGTDSTWTHTYDGTTPDPVLPGSYLNFDAGCLDFTHYADVTYGPTSYWDGFTVSKSSAATPFPCDTACSNTCNGLQNQFSSITGGGVLGANDPYAVAYYGYNDIYYPYNHCLVKLAAANTLCGLYVTNNAYAVKSMKCGDGFAHKFALGDSLVLVISGYLSGTYTNSVRYALADFRNASASYIVDSWKFVNLNALGTVDSLAFDLETSDVGAYGPNTPMYFCVDEIKVGTGASCGTCPATDNTHSYVKAASLAADVLSVAAKTTDDAAGVLQVAPNPAGSYVKVTGKAGAQLQIVDISGVTKYSKVMSADAETVETAAYAPGLYLIKTTSGRVVQTAKFIKQ